MLSWKGTDRWHVSALARPEFKAELPFSSFFFFLFHLSNASSGELINNQRKTQAYLETWNHALQEGKCSRAMFLYSERGEFPWLWNNEHFPQMGFHKLQRDLQGTPNSHLPEFLVSAAPGRSSPFCRGFQGLPVGFHVLSAVLSCWPLCLRICLKAVLPLRAELQPCSSFELTHNAHSRFRQLCRPARLRSAGGTVLLWSQHQGHP